MENKIIRNSIGIKNMISGKLLCGGFLRTLIQLRASESQNAS
jgi:hypothetical protein